MSNNNYDDMTVSNDELRGYMDGLAKDLCAGQSNDYLEGYRLGVKKRLYNESKKFIDDNFVGMF